MLRCPVLLSIAALLVAGIACESGRHSPAGFRLPAGGDPERGRVAFVALQCNGCHEVTGADLPKPTVQPPVPVALGGEVEREVTDGYLVASVINPSYRLASYPKNQITSGGKSRMPDYADKMTVGQLTDVVAYLQSRYIVRPLPMRYSYH